MEGFSRRDAQKSGRMRGSCLGIDRPTSEHVTYHLYTWPYGQALVLFNPTDHTRKQSSYPPGMSLSQLPTALSSDLQPVFPSVLLALVRPLFRQAYILFPFNGIYSSSPP